MASRQRNFGLKSRHISCTHQNYGLFHKRLHYGFGWWAVSTLCAVFVAGNFRHSALHTIIAHDCRWWARHGSWGLFWRFLVGLLESLISISKDYLPGPWKSARFGTRIIRAHSGFIYHLRTGGRLWSLADIAKLF